MTTMATGTQTEHDPAAEGSIREAMQEYWARVRGGDLGSLPAVLGLVALLIFFTVLTLDERPGPTKIAAKIKKGTK